MKQLSDETFSDFIQQATTPVLVDFNADWCGPCRMLAPHLEDLARSNRQLLTVASVDIDANPKIVEQFDITSIPRLILFRDGDVVDDQMGLVPRAELIQHYAELIPGLSLTKQRVIDESDADQKTAAALKDRFADLQVTADQAQELIASGQPVVLCVWPSWTSESEPALQTMHDTAAVEPGATWVAIEAGEANEIEREETEVPVYLVYRDGQCLTEQIGGEFLGRQSEVSMQYLMATLEEPDKQQRTLRLTQRIIEGVSDPVVVHFIDRSNSRFSADNQDSFVEGYFLHFLEVDNPDRFLSLIHDRSQDDGAAERLFGADEDTVLIFESGKQVARGDSLIGQAAIFDFLNDHFGDLAPLSEF